MTHNILVDFEVVITDVPCPVVDFKVVIIKGDNPVVDFVVD